MPKAVTEFYSAKSFPRDKGNPDITFCGSASIKIGGIALNEIKLKYNYKTKKFIIQFPEIRGSDGKYRPAYCTITKEAQSQVQKLIVTAARKAWGQIPADQQ